MSADFRCTDGIAVRQHFIVLTPRSPRVRMHRDLVIWQKAMDLVDETYALTGRFPGCERYGIIAQMRRSAVSIPANIVEGHGRNTTKDYLRFLAIAKGPLRELDTYCDVSERRQYATADELAQMRALADHIGRMHTALCRALRRKLRP